jgi:hypothetical protein
MDSIRSIYSSVPTIDHSHRQGARYHDGFLSKLSRRSMQDPTNHHSSASNVTKQPAEPLWYTRYIDTPISLQSTHARRRHEYRGRTGGCDLAVIQSTSVGITTRIWQKSRFYDRLESTWGNCRWSSSYSGSSLRGIEYASAPDCLRRPSESKSGRPFAMLIV